MKDITVNKADLLDKLRANRDDHRRIFEEAVDGFRKRAEAELKALLESVLAGRREDVRVGLYAPTDHTRDYDRAIAMLEMAIGDEMLISEQEFARYVLDDWGWQSEFLSNAYGSTTATGKFSDRYSVGE